MKMCHLLKYVSKLCALHFQIVAGSRPCVRFFSFRYRFKALTEWSLIFVVSRLKLFWIFSPKGLKNSNFSPKGPTAFKIWEWDSGYCWLWTCKNFQFCYVWYEVMAKRSKYLHKSCAFGWINLNELQNWFVCKSRSSFIRNFISIIAILEIFVCL